MDNILGNTDMNDILEEMEMPQADFDEIVSHLFQQHHESNDELIQLQSQCEMNQNQEGQQLEAVKPQSMFSNPSKMEAINLPPLDSKPNEYYHDQNRYHNQSIAILPSNNQQEIEMKLKWTEQPQSTIRFRPRTDPNTHGVIQGKSSASKVQRKIERKVRPSENYPSVQLQVTNNNKNIEKQNHEYYAVVDCYIKSEENTPILSPHKFGYKHGRNNRANKNGPKYDVIDGPIVEQMIPLTEAADTYKYSFKNFFIISQSCEAFQAVKNKYTQFQDKELIGQVDGIFQNYLKSKETIVTQSNNAICLGFSIYEKIQSVYEYRRGPKLSTPIHHANKTVKIVRVCNLRGQKNEDITLLVTGITEKNVTVHIMEDGGDWKTEIQNDALKVHQNAAITFKLPPYNGQKQHSDDINCKIYLMRNDGVQSEPSSFVYSPPPPEDIKRKIPRVSEASNKTTAPYKKTTVWQSTSANKGRQMVADGITSSAAMRNLIVAQIPNETKIATGMDKWNDIPSVKGKKIFADSVCYSQPVQKESNNCEKTRQFVNNSKDIENSINKLKKALENGETIYEFAYRKCFGNTLFYDAIEYDKFLMLYQIIEKYGLKELVLKSHNDYGDTVLHHACRLRKYQFIRALIGMNSRLSAQNNERQTPLHVAIESGDKPTVEVWTKLIQDPTQYEHFGEEFKRSLRVYDRQGFTVLHRAIINDQRALVKAIMEFCQNADIPLHKYEVLGNGDSILHLAFSRDLKEIMELIIEIEPDSIYYENYIGENYKREIDEDAEEVVDIFNNLSLK